MLDRQQLGWREWKPDTVKESDMLPCCFQQFSYCFPSFKKIPIDSITNSLLQYILNNVKSKWLFQISTNAQQVNFNILKQFIFMLPTYSLIPMPQSYVKMQPGKQILIIIDIHYVKNKINCNACRSNLLFFPPVFKGSGGGGEKIGYLSYQYEQDGSLLLFQN